MTSAKIKALLSHNSSPVTLNKAKKAYPLPAVPWHNPLPFFKIPRLQISSEARTAACKYLSSL